MAEITDNCWQLTAPTEAVVNSRGTSYVSVQEARWATWQPNLPAEIAAYLATPVVVGAIPLPRPAS
jgi:hypothetical protein